MGAGTGMDTCAGRHAVIRRGQRRIPPAHRATAARAATLTADCSLQSVPVRLVPAPATPRKTLHLEHSWHSKSSTSLVCAGPLYAIMSYSELGQQPMRPVEGSEGFRRQRATGEAARCQSEATLPGLSSAFLLLIHGHGEQGVAHLVLVEEGGIAGRNLTAVLDHNLLRGFPLCTVAGRACRGGEGGRQARPGYEGRVVRLGRAVKEGW
eukprot:scaffold8537_cov146-Isochrysis_galbana.AAC.1